MVCQEWRPVRAFLGCPGQREAKGRQALLGRWAFKDFLVCLVCLAQKEQVDRRETQVNQAFWEQWVLQANRGSEENKVNWDPLDLLVCPAI